MCSKTRFRKVAYHQLLNGFWAMPGCSILCTESSSCRIRTQPSPFQKCQHSASGACASCIWSPDILLLAPCALCSLPPGAVCSWTSSPGSGISHTAESATMFPCISRLPDISVANWVVLLAKGRSDLAISIMVHMLIFTQKRECDHVTGKLRKLG